MKDSVGARPVIGRASAILTFVVLLLAASHSAAETTEHGPLDDTEQLSPTSETPNATNFAELFSIRKEPAIRLPEKNVTSRPPSTATTKSVWSPVPSPKICNRKVGGCTDEEVIVEATNFLQNLSTPEVSVTSAQLPAITLQVNKILRVRDNVSVHTNEVIQYIDVILTKMKLDPKQEVASEVASEVAVMVADIGQLNPVAGLAFTTTRGNLTPKSVQPIHLGDTGQALPPETELAVILPPSLLKRNTRMLFVVFATDRAFEAQPTSNSALKQLVNSRVLNINLSNGRSILKELPQGEYIDILFKPYITDYHWIKRCAFWDANNLTWSTQGTNLVKESTNQLDTCRYNHMTNFAQIITGKSVNKVALDVISLVGCTLSLIGILGIFVTALKFESWRQHLGNKILLNLSAAIALNLVMFLVIATHRLQDGTAGCITVGAIFHFSILSAFCWMLVSAGLQYLRLVIVLGSRRISHLLLKTCLFAWGIPVIPVVILLALDPTIYSTKESIHFCYPRGIAYYLALFLPILIVIIINAIVFASILYKIYPCHKSKLSTQTYSTNRKVMTRRVLTTILLFFLFGLTWIFGLFARFTVFAYLFCVTATLQGFVLFIFFVVVEQKARSYWVNSTSAVTSSERTVSSKANSMREGVPLHVQETYRQTGSELSS